MNPTHLLVSALQALEGAHDGDSTENARADAAQRAVLLFDRLSKSLTTEPTPSVRITKSSGVYLVTILLPGTRDGHDKD